MDWRNRRYFLVRYSSAEAPVWMRRVPTVKCYPPYNHAKQIEESMVYDGGSFDIQLPSYMVSVAPEYAATLIGNFKVAHLLSDWNQWIEITKEMCGQ